MVQIDEAKFVSSCGRLDGFKGAARQEESKMDRS